MSRESRRERAMNLFEEWKRDPDAFNERYRIPMTFQCGQDPKVGALNSIANHVLGSGYVVHEVICADPVLFLEPV
ncbi:hypothetical protein SAMN05444164_0702 [Bradyrhizobium erythrophlei]|uniref:Uncharacterized protein n=2 Tax=Bradyrhizobium erythrophlei TaxID=1437360 RepID=A0A1H4NQQ2_9BRAD|nr:hypothetical protein SAMN05444164_0702 [Bradyrhizobium erythrophlei]